MEVVLIAGCGLQKYMIGTAYFLWFMVYGSWLVGVLWLVGVEGKLLFLPFLLLLINTFVSYRRIRRTKGCSG